MKEAERKDKVSVRGERITRESSEIERGRESEGGRENTKRTNTVEEGRDYRYGE